MWRYQNSLCWFIQSASSMARQQCGLSTKIWPLSNSHSLWCSIPVTPQIPQPVDAYPGAGEIFDAAATDDNASPGKTARIGRQRSDGCIEFHKCIGFSELHNAKIRLGNTIRSPQSRAVARSGPCSGESQGF